MEPIKQELRQWYLVLPELSDHQASITLTAVRQWISTFLLL